MTRVQVLIREGRLPALRVGRNYIIDEADLKLVANRKPGRPSSYKINSPSSKMAATKRRKP